MNSESESDWDSMSEAPKIPEGVNQQGLVIYPPAPSNSDHKDRSNIREASSSNEVASTNNKISRTAERNENKQKSHNIAQEAKAKVEKKKLRAEPPKSAPVPKTRETKVNLPALNNSKGSSCSRDSGIDTSTIPSSKASPNNAKDKIKEDEDMFSDIGAGKDNPAFDTDSEDSSNIDFNKPSVKHYPEAEEKIGLLTFEELQTKYFQIQIEDEGLIVDRVIPPLADCCSRIVSEALGINISLFILFKYVKTTFFRHPQNSPDHHVCYHWQHSACFHQQSPQTLLRLHSQASPSLCSQSDFVSNILAPLQYLLHPGYDTIPLLQTNNNSSNSLEVCQD